MLMAHILLGMSSLIIVYQDIRWQMFSLGALGMFGIASVMQQIIVFNAEGLWSAAVLLIIFAGCQGWGHLKKHKLIMGTGDLILAPLCGLWLRLTEFPIFLIFAGLLAFSLALIWYFQWKMSRFPLAPPLLIALVTILIMRCFF